MQTLHPAVSVVVLCYNQQEYLPIALESVFRQKYPFIELIIADDGTEGFQIRDWEEFIRVNAGDNIICGSVYSNHPNKGTVRNLNGALRQCTGKYVLFFAGDDALASENSLSELVKAHEAKGNSYLCTTGLACKMDSKLECSKGFFQSELVRKSGTLSSENAHQMLLYECCYTMGATLFDREQMLLRGGFDEKYRVIEDWSFYLSFTRLGGRIQFHDSPVLLHREGGISENANFSEVYKKDLQRIYMDEIFPCLRQVSDRKRRTEIILHYSSVFGYDKAFVKNCLRNCGAVFIYIIKKIFGGKNG